ncbi:efflux RND transporter periplasmic adaptor subunit [Desulfatitalea tepidiphila]|uniref:efflux RND transporter periplasmic adaptor subunit n=1 Tax=Desulfatitalea tepidiphila TaxID=1185843 RepID=UPI0006B4970B|nr:efflux RND transporter periplasmic adaptor subunit [Desulfatitalea tepidiphila]
MNKSKTTVRAFMLFAALAAIGGGLAMWKHAATEEANAATASQAEPMETVMAAVAKPLEHRQTATAIGTVLALRSITLRNELAGTVQIVMLTPGQIVEPGAVLVKLDVSVEQAELKAQEAQAALARTTLRRMKQAHRNRAASEIEVDRAAAELDIALAQIARNQAIIARKTIRAPFRARVGLADVHVGQYLNEGTQLTTLQGVDDAVHVDFRVAQQVAEGLTVDQWVDVFPASDAQPTKARIVALDARIDPETRNAMVRARMDGAAQSPAPGASVRIRIPIGPTREVVAVPVNALRKGPDGDFVFIIEPDQHGRFRARLRTVRSGAVQGDEIAIYEGLSPGDRIAAAGSFKLRENTLVALANGNGE